MRLRIEDEGYVLGFYVSYPFFLCYNVDVICHCFLIQILIIATKQWIWFDDVFNLCSEQSVVGIATTVANFTVGNGEGWGEGVREVENWMSKSMGIRSSCLSDNSKHSISVILFTSYFILIRDNCSLAVILLTSFCTTLAAAREGLKLGSQEEQRYREHPIVRPFLFRFRWTVWKWWVLFLVTN